MRIKRSSLSKRGFLSDREIDQYWVQMRTLLGAHPEDEGYQLGMNMLAQLVGQAKAANKAFAIIKDTIKQAEDTLQKERQYRLNLEKQNRS